MSKRTCPYHPIGARGRHRRGLVLVAVLVIVALAAMVAASLMFRLRAELSASAGADRGEEAYAAAESGLRTALALLARLDDPAGGGTRGVSGGPAWYDNPDLFRQQLVADDGRNRWYFTVFAAPDDDGSGVGGSMSSPDGLRYGLTDEAGKINLNAADPETLRALPRMTPELVDALLDYRDADSSPRAGGAEQEDYDALPRPYAIRNGPFGSVDELLMVKGFNASVLYGEDANLNGRLESNEDDGDASLPPDDGDGRLNPGLRGLLTVFSHESNLNQHGRPRLDLNTLTGGGPARGGRDGPRPATRPATPESSDPDAADDSVDAASDPADPGVGLSDETLRFIRLYLAEGNRFAHPSELLDMTYTLTEDHREESAVRGEAIRSGVGGTELSAVLDGLMTKPGAGRRAGPTPRRGLPTRPAGRPKPPGGAGFARPGDLGEPGGGIAATAPASEPSSDADDHDAPAPIPVNVDTAPRAVLAALPGIGPELAGQIVAARGQMDAEAAATPAWLFTQGIMDAEAFKAAAPRLTARGRQFHLTCLGFGLPTGRYRVIEAVIDAPPGETPRVLYLRDITRLGLPLALEVKEGL